MKRPPSDECRQQRDRDEQRSQAKAKPATYSDDRHAIVSSSVREASHTPRGWPRQLVVGVPQAQEVYSIQLTFTPTDLPSS